MTPGRATLEGTRGFRGRSKAAPQHFRSGAGVLLSSIGLGTYLGEEDADTDRGYEASIAVALGFGINVFDSAINYRGQRSESFQQPRLVGRIDEHVVRRGDRRGDEGLHVVHDVNHRARAAETQAGVRLSAKR